jgi:hypothetical protein
MGAYIAVVGFGCEYEAGSRFGKGLWKVVG